MNELTWVSVVGVLLLVGQVLSLYNSMNTARKNATEPLNEIRRAVRSHTDEIMGMKRDMDEMKRDLNSAFDKIRENKEETERTAKAQNAALVQILLLLKEPEKRNDQKIDETIKELSSI
jgi:hypothetical protein